MVGTLSMLPSNVDQVQEGSEQMCSVVDTSVYKRNQQFSCGKRGDHWVLRLDQSTTKQEVCLADTLICVSADHECVTLVGRQQTADPNVMCAWGVPSLDRMNGPGQWLPDLIPLSTKMLACDFYGTTALSSCLQEY